MKNKKLIACWDTYKARNNFGSLLIFLSEVEAISYEYDRIDIVCIGLQKNIHVFISVMQFFSGIKNLLFFVDMDEYDRYVDDDGSDKWQNIVYKNLWYTRYPIWKLCCTECGSYSGDWNTAGYP